MLVELYGENFGCFRDPFSLSMLAVPFEQEAARGVIEARIIGDPDPLCLLRAVAVYGANASGKSTVLRAASALGQLLGTSHNIASDTPLAPYEPFALGPHRSNPVRLGIKAVIDGFLYDYSLGFYSNRFVSERLVRRTAEDEAVLIDRQDQNAVGEWTTDPQFKLVSRSYRANALLLGLADSLAPDLAQQIAATLKSLLRTVHSHEFFRHDSVQRGRSSAVAQRANDDPLFRNWLTSQIRSADIGVVALKIDEREGLGVPRELPDGRFQVERTTAYDLSLLHSGEEQEPIRLPFRRESEGTRRLVDLSSVFYGLVHDTHWCARYVDELDASLHPALLNRVIRHFNCETEMASVRGQLVFSTHETSLLDGEARSACLRRDQVYFTEKSSDGSAKLYSLSEFRERNNLNIRKRYLQGRYGALPALGDFT